VKNPCHNGSPPGTAGKA